MIPFALANWRRLQENLFAEDRSAQLLEGIFVYTSVLMLFWEMFCVISDTAQELEYMIAFVRNSIQIVLYK